MKSNNEDELEYFAELKLMKFCAVIPCVFKTQKKSILFRWEKKIDVYEKSI
jgi:hypothetical protein